MNRSLFRIVCCVVVVVLAALVASSPAEATSRVFGGTKVSDADFASRYEAVVSIQRRVGPRFFGGRSNDVVTHVCGGTLIAPRLVLTAAHCVEGGGLSFDVDGYEVLAGHSTLAAARTTSGRVAVDAVFVHPEYQQHFGLLSFGIYGYGGYGFSYGRRSTTYDVAVLRLAEPITDITPVPLVAPSEDAAAWGNGAGRPTGAVTLGWGSSGSRFSFVRTKPVSLQVADMPIRADRRCERSDGGLGQGAFDFYPEEQLCAGIADGPGKTNTAHATCYGDDGGPLLAPVADGSLRVVGVSGQAPYGPTTCVDWSVFARVAALRDWISSIPADSGGPDSLVAPTNVSATPTGVNSLRVSWTPSASGTPARYIVNREISSEIAKRLFYGAPGTAFTAAAITDDAGTSIEIEGVAPRRPGTTATRRIRVDVIDDEGNRVEGAETAVSAPIDAKRPSRPSRPRLVIGRRLSGPSLRFIGSFDADCVAEYRVQLQSGDGAWRTVSTNHRYECETQLLGYGYPYPTNSRTRPQVVRIGHVEAGSYRARIVAVDRAGNFSASRPIRIRLAEATKGGRTVNVIIR